MKKLLILPFLIVSLWSLSQTTTTADRIVARQSFYLRNYWVDTLRNDTLFQGATKSLPTADAVYRFVKSRFDNLSVSSSTKFGVAGEDYRATQARSFSGANAHPFIWDSIRVEFDRGIDVASANDLTVGLGGNAFIVTGTTNIQRIATSNWQEGSIIWLHTTSSLVIKNNITSGGGFAAILLSGETDLTTDSVTVLSLIYLNSKWHEVSRKTLGSVGTVTNFIFTDGNGFDGTVGTSTSIPTLSLTTTVADTRIMYSVSGAITGAAGFTFNGISTVTLGVAGASTGVLKITGVTSGTVTVQAASAAGTYTLTLPTDDGSADQLLKTDGNGVLSWVTISSSSTVNTGAQYKAAYYPSAGTTVDDWVGVSFGQTGINTEITQQVISDIALKVIGIGSQTGDYVRVINSGSTEILNFNASGELLINTTDGGAYTLQNGSSSWFKGAARFTGTISGTAASVDRVDIGVETGTPRMYFEDAGSVWAIDNNAGSFRWFTLGVVQLEMTTSSTAIGQATAIGTGSITRQLNVYRDDATNSTVVPVLRIQHSNSNTPGVGVGTAIEFLTESSASVFPTTAVIESIISTTTVAGETSDLAFKTLSIDNNFGTNLAGERFKIFGKVITLTESSATSFLVLPVNDSTSVGGVLVYTIEANDGIEWQTLTGVCPYSLVNKLGTITTGLGTDSQVTAVSSGTLTATLTLVDGGSNTATFKLNAVSSLTQTVLRVNCQVMKNYDNQQMTMQ